MMFKILSSIMPISAIVALVATSMVPLTALADPPAPAKDAKVAAKVAAKVPAKVAVEVSAAGAPAADAAGADGVVAEPAPPPPPKPGQVIISSDTDGLTAEVAGVLKGLKLGETHVELQPGPYKIVVTDKNKKTVTTFDITLKPEGEIKLKVVTRGKIVVPVEAGTSVKIDGKDVVAKKGKACSKLAAGKHSLVVTSPGMVGNKGDVEVMAGKTYMITTTLKPFDAGSKPAAWAAIIGGGGLILAGVLMESFAEPRAMGGDATRWGLMGVGTAGFVGGTILMKEILKNEANPPIEEGGLKVKVAAP